MRSRPKNRATRRPPNHPHHEPTAPPPAPRPDQPPWVPAGKELLFVPEAVQRAIADLIEPIYRQLVLDAPDALEKSIGISITHLLWLEIISQFDLKRDYTQVEAVLGISMNRDSMIAQQLRLIDSKVRAGYYLMRIHEFRRRLAQQPTVPTTALALPAAQPAIPPANPASTERPLLEKSTLVEQKTPAETEP